MIHFKLPILLRIVTTDTCNYYYSTVSELEERVTCYVEGVTASLCTAIYAGILLEMNHELRDCHVKVQSLCLKRKCFSCLIGACSKQ